MLLFCIFNTFIFLIIYFYFNLKIQKFLKNSSIFFFSLNHVILSINHIFIFILIFIIFFRILKIFVSVRSYVDTNQYLFFFFKIVNLEYYYLYMMNIIFIIFFFNLLRKYYFIFIKLHFLKLYYFYFYRYFYIRFFFKKLSFYDLGLRKYSIFLYYLHIFFRDFFFKFIFLYFIFIGIFFNNGFVYIGFLPYYSIYYLTVSIILFLKKFNNDFDEGILQCYYPDHFCPLKIGLDKIQIYKIYLLFNSNYHFCSNIIYDYENNFYKKYIFYKNCDILFYNSNNIFEIAQKIEPQFINLSIYNYCYDLNHNNFL